MKTLILLSMLLTRTAFGFDPCITSTSIPTGSSYSELFNCVPVVYPKLQSKDITYPLIGANSHEVKFWYGEIRRPRVLRIPFVFVVTNKCTKKTVSTTYLTKAEDESYSVWLENPNLSEAISNVNLLGPISENAAKKAFESLLQRCNLGEFDNQEIQDGPIPYNVHDNGDLHG